jgi:hypothetical protein
MDDFKSHFESQISSSIFLLRFEPKVVWPLNYVKQVVGIYGTIFDIGRLHNLADVSYYWPQFWPEIFPEIHEKRFDKVAIISGNKFSLVPGELYSLRRKCILRIENIAHFGTAWDMSNFKRLKVLMYEIRKVLRYRLFPNLRSVKYWFKKYDKWLGSPSEKLNCLSAYKYTLVIENSADYLSEKLFDAFFSFTIPIYVGPDISDYGIPANLVVQCDPSLNAIKDGIIKASKIDYLTWCNDVKTWLDLPETRAKWDGYVVYGQIIDEIKKRTERII